MFLTTAISREVLERGVLLGGEEISTSSRSHVTNPYDGEVVGSVGQATAEQATAAVGLAHAALDAPIPAHERATVLDRVADELLRRREELALLISSEVGKPIALARSEVDRAASTYRVSAAVARTRTGNVVAMDATAAGANKLAYTVNRPIGVVTAITPFNFPLNLVAHKLAPALAAGCPVVLKPAPQSPLTAFVLADICSAAGLPAGYLSVVPGEPAEISAAIVQDPRVAAISFTGSTEVGWHIAASAPRKKVLLELGNASPAIIEPDADLERAANLLAPNAFVFAGQTCVSVQRIYVDRAVHDEFLDLLVTRTGELASGDPRDEQVVCGPLIDNRVAERTLAAIRSATEQGAEVVSGGERRSDGVVPPTVVNNVAQSSDLIQKEAFAPVVSVIGVESFDRAIDMANDSQYGLQAAVFTQNLDKALTATERLDFGAVLVNEAPSFRADNMPYGGLRNSGNTKEGPESTAAALTVERLCVFSR
ncbi:aldehyde dehydrogenase family protein [Rhodococcus sp. 14C212]|uniref:aldehyde dehydrogenase family protein n=1 Tax=Rhodococcus sp. 14C212 TaxID=2711209 RepID=UPI0013EBBBF8|nr:aldehyde dehydrogenase family protein [Rhodococcus sp. 14C212]NGP05701.1 aldehyde dehydrogenase family protein [Rhodococcus sp. 14C212]